MEKSIKKSSKLVSYRRGGFNFAPAPILRPAPKQAEKSLGREVFELLLEAVSPDTLKVRRFTESLATSRNLSKQARSVLGYVSTIIDIVGFFKLLDAVAPGEPDHQARRQISS
jgi:hypothetical protein